MADNRRLVRIAANNLKGKAPKFRRKVLKRLRGKK